MAEFNNYDPGRIIVTFRGILFQGVASGTFVNVERDTDTFSDEVGAYGDVVRVRSRDKRGTVKVTLLSSSLTNDALSVLHSRDEGNDDGGGLGYGSLLIKDLNGTTLVSAKNAWLMKPADLEYGDEGGQREWTLKCAELNMFVGGSVF